MEGLQISLSEESIYKVFLVRPEFQGVQITLPEENITEEIYGISQTGGSNGWLVKETSAGVWDSEFDIDLKSNLNPEIQALVNTHSGLPAGTTEFTAQQAFDMATASGGDIKIRFLEEISPIAVPSEKLETIVARFDFTGVDGNIYSFDII